MPAIGSGDVDLLDHDAFARGVPHAWFSYLREHAPVFRHPEPNGPGFWVVSRYEDIRAVSRNPSVYSSDQARGGIMGLEDIETPEYVSQGGQMLITLDPPAHTRYRGLVSRDFSPRAVSRLEPAVRVVATRVLDRAIDLGRFDFVSEIAAPLPLHVIGELLGLPEEDLPMVFDWSNRLFGSTDPEYQVSEDIANRTQLEFFAYVDRLTERRRAAPHDDLVSALIATEVDGARLTQIDLDVFVMLLAAAGNETTRNALSHGFDALLDHADAYQALVEDPTVAATTAEEVLRWATPVMFFRRNVTTDTELAGKELRAGDKVSMWYISANRDDNVFADPFVFDGRRSPNPHLTFGGTGPHFCLGAALARLEIRVFLEELAARCRTIRRVGSPERLRSNWVNGFKRFPAELVRT